MIMGCDLDGVLANTNEAFCKYSNKNYGTQWSMDDVSDYDMSECLRNPDGELISREELWDRYDLFMKTSSLSIRQNTSLCKWLEWCHVERGDRIYVITARSRANRGSAQSFYHTYLDRFCDGLLFDSNKADACKYVEADVMIEDSPYNIEQCCMAGIPAITVDQPYNRGLPTILRLTEGYQLPLLTTKAKRIKDEIAG